MTEPLIDRLIAYFSPERGLARARARAARATVLSYEGGRTGRRAEGWTSATIGTAADVEIHERRGTLRDRARDLVRNNPHAAKALLVIVQNKIGTGIMPQAVSGTGRRPNRRQNRRADDWWARFSDNCDAAGRHDFYGIQALAERTRAESGEALIRVIPTTPRSERDVPLRLQVLEADYLDSQKHQALGPGRDIRYGIEYEGERPVAYWLYEDHPGASLSPPRVRSLASVRVPASEVIHYYKPQRPGQVRGVTDFAPVIARLRDLDDGNDAELMRRKIAACLVGVVTTPAGLPGGSLSPSTTDDDSRQIESMHPGQWAYLKPGEAVNFNTPPSPPGIREFNTDQLHAIAAGIGIPYELLTGDLSEVNYTSHRGGLVQFRGQIEADQWQIVIPQICRPIWRRAMLAAGVLDPALDVEVEAEWTPPRFGLLDPAKEIPAMAKALATGIESYQNLQRREGYDWREKLAEIAEERALMDELGISLEGISAPVEPEPETEPMPEPPEEGDESEEDESEAA